MPEASPYPLCEHIREDGTICRSPALTDHRFCYYHQRDLARRRNLRQARDLRSTYYRSAAPPELEAEVLESLDLPMLENATSVQVALTNVLRALAGRHIRLRRAALLLYGLQSAVTNLRNIRAENTALPEVVDMAVEDPAPIGPLIQFDVTPRPAAATEAVLDPDQQPEHAASTRPPVTQDSEESELGEGTAPIAAEPPAAAEPPVAAEPPPVTVQTDPASIAPDEPPVEHNVIPFPQQPLGDDDHQGFSDAGAD